MGDRGGESFQLYRLGEVAAERGNPDEAERRFKQALDIRREMGDRKESHGLWNRLGRLATEIGDLEEAERRHRQALEVDRDIGNRKGESQGIRTPGDNSPCNARISRRPILFKRFGPHIEGD